MTLQPLDQIAETWDALTTPDDKPPARGDVKSRRTNAAALRQSIQNRLRLISAR